jgi:hypothetical protein
MAYNVFTHFTKAYVKELLNMCNILTKTEYNLYLLLGSLCEQDKDIETYKDSSLAKELDLSLSSVANAKTGLKQKGYALILWFKDEKNKPVLRVVLGKDQVELYNKQFK